MEESIEGPNRDTTFAQYTGIEPGTKKPDFEAKKNLEFELLKKDKMRKLEEKKEKQYFYIMRKRNNDNEASTEVFTYNKWSQSRSNILSFDDNSILQEFIYPRGPNACITRLFYFTKHNKEMKANFGYKIRNKYQLHDDKADRVGIDQLAVVNKTDDPKIGAFTVNHLAGVSLVEYEAYAEELVSYLERAYPVRIKSITLDFVTDHLKRHILFNVKDIDLDHMEQTSKDPNEKKRTLDELTCSVYCKLCGLIFKKDEASKTLTYKLLWELAQHLKKRGKGLHGIEVSHSSTRPCRVCDLCYMVVVSEHELIELEQQFARVQNIPISDPYLRVPIEKKAKHRPALLGETLKQWRFMIYLQTLNFEGENLFKTNNIDKDSVHLQVKLFRIKNDFPLNLVEIAKDPNSTIEDGYDYTYSYEINLLRVYYFFSDKQDIKNFLQDTELQVRITYTKDWNNYIAQGSTRTLSQFDNNRLKGQKHESRIYMFFDSAEYCTIRFTAGLVCDGDFNTASMNLHKFNGIYFPNDDFYNCNIFPEEWIEIFMDEKRDDPNKDGNEGFETKGKPYTPVCTPAEMRKMLEPNHHSNRIEVETKVEHRLDTKKHEEFKKQLRLEKESKKSRPYSMYSNQDDAVTMQTNLKATHKHPDGDLAIGGPSGRPGTGASFRLRVDKVLPRNPRPLTLGSPRPTVTRALIVTQRCTSRSRSESTRSRRRSTPWEAWAGLWTQEPRSTKFSTILKTLSRNMERHQDQKAPSGSPQPKNTDASSTSTS